MAALGTIWSNMGLCLCKPETTHGLDSSPVVGTDALYVRNLTIKPASETVDLKAIRETAAAPGEATTAIDVDVEIELHVAGPIVDTDIKADLQKVYSACRFAMTSTGTPVTSRAFAPNSRTHGSCTLYNYLYGDAETDAELQIVTGLVLAPKLMIPDGDVAYWSLSGKGLFSINTNPALPAHPTYLHPTDVCPPRSWTISADSRDDQIAAMEIDFGWEVVARKSLGATYGYAGHVLRRARSPQITVNPEAVYTDVYDYATKALANTTFAFSATGDTIGGGRIVIAAPNAQWRVPPIEVGDGTMIAPNTITCRDNTSAGDDAITVTISRTP